MCSQWSTVRVKATNRPLRLMKGLFPMEKFQFAKLSIYELEEADRPVVSFRPDIVPIVPMQGCPEEVSVWPPPPRAAPRRPRGRGRGGAEVDAEGSPRDAVEDEPEVSDGDGGADADFGMDELEAIFIEAMEDGSFALPDDPQEGDEVDAPLPPPPLPPPAAPPLVVEAPDTGGAASSSDAPPPVAPLPPALDVAREVVVVWVELPGQGKITYYRKSGNFVAKCANRLHGKCELTRTTSAAPQKGRLFTIGGRPLGFMAAWLARGCDCVDKPAHWQHANFDNSLVARQEARAALGRTAQGRALLQQERDLAPGEPEEPLDLTPYM